MTKADAHGRRKRGGIMTGGPLDHHFSLRRTRRTLQTTADPGDIKRELVGQFGFFKIMDLERNCFGSSMAETELRGGQFSDQGQDNQP